MAFFWSFLLRSGLKPSSVTSDKQNMGSWDFAGPWKLEMSWTGVFKVLWLFTEEHTWLCRCTLSIIKILLDWLDFLKLFIYLLHLYVWTGHEEVRGQLVGVISLLCGSGKWPPVDLGHSALQQVPLPTAPSQASPTLAFTMIWTVFSFFLV